MKRILCLIMIFLLVSCGSAEVFSPFNARDGKLQALNLLKICAFSTEYGDERDTLARWEGPIRVYVGGAPTETDMNELDAFLMELSFRVPMLPKVERVENADSANMQIFFVPEKEMGNYVKNYVKDNNGFVTYYYAAGVINRAEIAIACDTTTQKERNGILREEIVNGIGLGNDHSVYEDSILYDAYSEVQTLSEVDWLMLNMVYSLYTRPNMTWNRAYRAIYDGIIR